jgi:hypothetical protein
MHHIALHPMHCTFVSISYLCIVAINPAELELEEPTEQVQVEDLTNPDLDQGKPSAFNHTPCLLI